MFEQEFKDFQYKTALDFIEENLGDVSKHDVIREIIRDWKNRFFPETCEITIDADDDLMMQIFSMAHDKNITFNQFVTTVLEDQLSQEERNREFVEKLEKVDTENANTDIEVE